jgi:[ribosomal protein S18]-alanine N-acetyltransferase
MNVAPALTLRLARLDEARVMAEMSRELIETGLGWRYTPARMKALISDPETVALVACDGAGIQGLALMHFAEQHGHLVLLCVRPARQRQGTGRRLLEWLLASARVAGLEAVGLELRADNPAALQFYRALGFSETQWLAGYYSGRVAAQRMSLRLGLGLAPGRDLG